MFNQGKKSQRLSFGPRARDFLPPEPSDPTSVAADSAAGPARPGAKQNAGASAVVTAQAAARQESKLLEKLRADGRSRRPEPRLPGKHALNPPIVTIFGAGVAGLTAAHELVDRGFLVQVVEASEDLSCPGRPIVGGLAANQPARVRANIEDLHRDIMIAALTPQVDGEPQALSSTRRVAAWLLNLFAFNRSRWIQTEEPQRINGCIFSSPTDPAAKIYKEHLLRDLANARHHYRNRWLWDLIVRPAMLGAIKPRTPDVDVNADCKKLYDKLMGADVAVTSISKELLTHFEGTDVTTELPSSTQIHSCPSLVTLGMEREFLSFRLIPFARQGFEDAPRLARALYQEWLHVFESHDIFKYSCVSCPPPEMEQALNEGTKHTRSTRENLVPLDGDGVPIAVEVAEAPPEFPFQAWLQLEIVEQRLPGEHGYRFFPSFYRHLDDTMARIPLYQNGQTTGRTVLDNLKPTVFQGIGLSDEDRKTIVSLRQSSRRPNLEAQDPNQRDDRYPNYDDPMLSPCRDEASGAVVELHREKPRSIEAFRDCTDRFVKRLGGTRRDAVILLSKLIRFMTSSPERRRAKYEDLTWAEFLDVSKFSKPMQKQIQSAAQALLAFSASEADARTYGNIAVQMLLDELRDGTRVDRTLNGPTSDAWLEPWREHLERQGVRFFLGRLSALELKNDEIIPRIDFSSAQDRVSQDAHEILTASLANEGLRPDFYVLALNIEQSQRLIEQIVIDPGADAAAPVTAGVVVEKHKDLAPDFATFLDFGKEVQDRKAMKTMTGVQYFFDAKTDVGRGHMYFPFSSWGLSSISQSQFWSRRGSFSDGYFGLLSVDVCTTGIGPDGPPEPGSFADALRPGEQKDGYDVQRRVLETGQQTLKQIADRIGGGRQLGDPRCLHIDRNLSRPAKEKTEFLASMAGMKKPRAGLRPVGPDGHVCVGVKEIEYDLNFKRWVLCGTFMATRTRMTTMESANESGRHAVAAILRRLSMDDASDSVKAEYLDHGYQIENLSNRTYNWASKFRTYEAPPTWNPEDEELEDLDFFRRVDRRLMNLNLPHLMDIVDFDDKVEHAVQAIELYGREKPLSNLFGASMAGLDAGLVKELGDGYAKLETARWDEATRAAAGPPFGDMVQINERWKKVLGLFRL